MKLEDRALLLIVVAAIVVATAGAAYFLVVAGSLPGTLPVPAGTRFTANASEQWVAHFTVAANGSRIVGAWTAYSGTGWITLIVVNGTVSKPWPPPVRMCPLLLSWPEYNGSIDEPLGAGPHTAYWNTGYCASAAQIVVTQTIQLAPP